MLRRAALRVAVRVSPVSYHPQAHDRPLTALSPVLRGSRRDEGRPEIKRHPCGVPNKGWGGDLTLEVALRPRD